MLNQKEKLMNMIYESVHKSSDYGVATPVIKNHHQARLNLMKTEIKYKSENMGV
jgi:hypothetical protein